MALPDLKGLGHKCPWPEKLMTPFPPRPTALGLLPVHGASFAPERQGEEGCAPDYTICFSLARRSPWGWLQCNSLAALSPGRGFISLEAQPPVSPSLCRNCPRTLSPLRVGVGLMASAQKPGPPGPAGGRLTRGRASQKLRLYPGASPPRTELRAGEHHRIGIKHSFSTV